MENNVFCRFVKTIWLLQHQQKLFLSGPNNTFIWSRNRRLDKSPHASPKYEPIEQSGQKTSKLLNLFQKSFLASFLAEIKAVVMCRYALH